MFLSAAECDFVGSSIPQCRRHNVPITGNLPPLEMKIGINMISHNFFHLRKKENFNNNVPQMFSITQCHKEHNVWITRKFPPLEMKTSMLSIWFPIWKGMMENSNDFMSFKCFPTRCYIFKISRVVKLWHTLSLYMFQDRDFTWWWFWWTYWWWWWWLVIDYKAWNHDDGYVDKGNRSKICGSISTLRRFALNPFYLCTLWHFHLDVREENDDDE